MFLAIFTVVWIAVISLLYSLQLDALATIVIVLGGVSWAGLMCEDL